MERLWVPIVLMWDRLTAHKSAAMRRLIATRPWLRVYPLPAYTPELNPVEKVWSAMKRSLARPARTAPAQAVKNRLKPMKYRDGLIRRLLRFHRPIPTSPNLTPSPKGL